MRFSLVPILLLAFLATAADGGIHYDFDQPFFVEEMGIKCKDHALVFGDDDLYHLFYIQSLPDGPIGYLDREQWLGHATSPDLRSWTRRDSILPVIPDTWEEGFIWAPSIVEDPSGPGWYLFYTGADTSSVVRQRMGMAHSLDLYAWDRDVDNPVYEPTGWTDWAAPIYQMANCRDPEVFQVPGDENWYCINTVRAADGGGALDLAVSPDLHTWTHQDTFSWHSSASMIESASLWEDVNGKWHLFYVIQNYAGTYHLCQPDPFGPWWPGAGSTFDSGYAAEVTEFEDRVIFSRFAKISLAAGNRYFIRFDELESPLPWHSLPLLQDDRGLEDHWTVEFGDAFTDQPTWGDNPVERGLPGSNLEGNSYLSSLEQHPYPGYPIPGRIRGNVPKGLLSSEVFTLEGDRLELLVGGGELDETCFVALVREIDGTVVHLETGRNEISMDPRLWDTSTLIGLDLFLVVADLADGEQGWICVDEIREYTREGEDPQPPSPPLPYPPLLIDLVEAGGYDLGVEFSAAPVYGRAPLTVLFENHSEGNYHSMEWDFQDDGHADTGYWRPTWDYTEPGLYSVRLTVFNDIGMTGTLAKEDLIRVLPPEANIILCSTEICSAEPAPVPISYMGDDSLGMVSLAVDFDSELLVFDRIESGVPGVQACEIVRNQERYS